MSIQIRIITAILFLWSGLLAFLPAQTVAAVPYDTVGEQFPNVLSAVQISTLAEKKIEETLTENGETRRHELHLQRSTNTMHLPAGEVTATVEFPRGIPYGRDFPALISVYVDGVLQRKTTNYYRVMVYDRVLVAMTDIRQEAEISPANARIEERAVDTAPAVTLTDFSKLGGRVAGRWIRKDTVITPNFLAMPLVIRVGNPVTLIFDMNGIVVRAEGAAMEGGRIGYTIRVRNVRSGKILRGKVIDAETVQISG